MVVKELMVVVLSPERTVQKLTVPLLMQCVILQKIWLLPVLLMKYWYRLPMPLVLQNLLVFM